MYALIESTQKIGDSHGAVNIILHGERHVLFAHYLSTPKTQLGQLILHGMVGTVGKKKGKKKPYNIKLTSVSTHKKSS